MSLEQGHSPGGPEGTSGGTYGFDNKVKLSTADTDKSVQEAHEEPPTEPTWVETLEALLPIVDAAAHASKRAAQWVFVPALLVQILGAGMIGYLLYNADDFTQAELQTVVIVGALLSLLGLVAIPGSYIQAGKAPLNEVNPSAQDDKARLDSLRANRPGAPATQALLPGTDRR